MYDHPLQFRLHVVLIAALLPGLVHRSAHAENWPQFRGPTGQGLTVEKALPTAWSIKDGANIRWKSPLPPTVAKGRADFNQSSPIVWGDQIFVTAVYWPADKPQSEFPEQHVACYRLADGAQQWDVTVPHGPWLLGDLRGGYGAPSPATDGQRVFVAFGSATVAALDLRGKLLWQHDLPDYKSIDVAYASSPILYRDTVLILCDRNNHAATLTAYDTASGAVRWEKRRPDVAFDHTTPLLVALNGRPQLLIAASNALQGVDPENGDVLWWVNTPGDVPTPVVKNDLIYTDSGRGGPGVAVTANGAGDITKTARKWRIANIPEGLSSAAIFGDALYRLHTPAVLRSFSLSDGKERFSARLEGVATQASPIITPDGLIYCASGGKSYVIKAGPKLDIVATNDLDDGSAASPAVAPGILIIKGTKYLYGIGR